MSLGKPKKALVLFLLSVPLLVGQLLAPKGMAQTQDQGPSGPKPNVDETVIAPKKAQPPAAVQPENKPEKINPNEVYSISTSTNLVNLDVLVEDRDGNPITSLGRKNFKLSDDGVPRTITNFATSEAPLTICLMIEFANRWWPFLYLALGDSYQFLNFMKPKDWVSVVDFDLKPHILTDFTQDRLEVRSALDTLRIPGFSEVNLYDALAFVVDRMKDIHGRKALIVICTGIDTFSKLNYDQALKIAKASDTSIYPVSILEFITVRSPRGDTIDSLQARNALTTIAKYSGGQAYFPRFEGELPGIYQQIAGQLRTQYSLGFMPSDPAREGRFHKIKVDLVDDDGSPLRITNEKGKQVKYRIVSRDGYYAPKS